MSIVTLSNINKSFGDHVIFKNFNLEIKENDFVSIMGNSGTGKTTLLNIIGLLEKPDSGTVEIAGIKNATFDGAKGLQLRRNTISYLFQNYGLVDSETVNYNLKIATKFLKYSKAEERSKIEDTLQTVGLGGFINKKVYQLSGGEQQRVAIAKLLLKPSKLLLADEPTGSLDATNRDAILDMLKLLNNQGKTIIVVTHDSVVNSCAKTHIKL
ncbi:MAG TPA: putative bacteriocin export ABC transporter [Clostridiales bacterium]|nr:putative bacteriocin export ABC transporter [Clostridiales bacterium]